MSKLNVTYFSEDGSQIKDLNLRETKPNGHYYPLTPEQEKEALRKDVRILSKHLREFDGDDINLLLLAEDHIDRLKAKVNKLLQERIR